VFCAVDLALRPPFRPARFTPTRVATFSRVRASGCRQRIAGGHSLPHEACDVTADLLKRLDMKVDFAAVDWGTVMARAAQKSPPRQGGWQMHVNAHYGVDADPSTNSLQRKWQRAVWANNPQIEAEIAAWYEATSLDEEKTIARRLNRLEVDHVVYAPLGVLMLHQAYRRNVSGIASGPLPFFWGVSKTA
jgi:peptide/nickel transport system substrate-binding protein